MPKILIAILLIEIVDQELIPAMPKDGHCPPKMGRNRENKTCCCQSNLDKCCWNRCEQSEPPSDNCIKPYLHGAYWGFDTDLEVYFAQHPKGKILM